MKIEIEGSEDEVKDIILRMAGSYGATHDWVEDDNVSSDVLVARERLAASETPKKIFVNNAAKGNKLPTEYKQGFAFGKTKEMIDVERLRQGLPIWVNGAWVKVPLKLEQKKEHVKNPVLSEAVRQSWARRKAAVDKKFKSWSDEEEQFIKDNYHKMTAGDIAKQLHRTLKGVYSRAANLGLADPVQSQRSHEAYMRQNHAFVPKSFDKQRIELAQAAVKHKPQQEQRVELPKFPTLKGLGVGVSDEVVFHIFGQFFNVTKELSFTKDSSVLGISDLREWANFITDVMMKRKEICACMGVDDAIKVKGLALVC